MDIFDIPRPGHLEDEAWAAIELSLVRLRRAWEYEDMPEVVGKAKELVEAVAKVAAAVTDGAQADLADFSQTVKRAHAALGRTPGPDLSSDRNVLTIAQGAQKIATLIGPIRNSHGTGHGHARVPDVAQEMAEVTSDAALLWSRWALRRLGHVLADYPNDLIEAVNSGTSFGTLKEKFDAVSLVQQPADVQLRLGVSFGQQAGGGYVNAIDVGVEPAITGDDTVFPSSYRIGVLKGLLITAGGQIGLTTWNVQRWVSLLFTLLPNDARSLLDDSAQAVRDAVWITTWRRTTVVDPHEVVAEFVRQGSRVPPDIRAAYHRLAEALRDAATRSAPES